MARWEAAWLVLCAMGAAGTVRGESPVEEGAALEVVHEAPGTFFEGPSWDPRGEALFFTAPNLEGGTLFRKAGTNAAQVWWQPTGAINGTYTDRDGTLLAAQGDTKRIVRVRLEAEGPGEPVTVVEAAEALRPNDVVALKNGGLYFSDPDFSRGSSNSGVWYVAPGTREAVRVLGRDAVQRPNGLAVSLDEDRLYVADSEAKLWRTFEIGADGALTGGRVFFEPEIADRRDPDGMTIDASGNLYLTGRGHVWAVDPEGRELARIAVEPFCSNVCFGGEDGRWLFITCEGRVVRIRMKVRGDEGPRGEED